MSIRNIIDRWSKCEEIALRNLISGKTANDRFRGFRRSERNEAKLFFVGMAPAISITPFMEKWSDASPVAKSLMAVTGLWMIGVFIFGAYLFSRSIYRALRKRSD